MRFHFPLGPSVGAVWREDRTISYSCVKYSTVGVSRNAINIFIHTAPGAGW